MKKLSILLIPFLVVGCFGHFHNPPVDLFVSTPQVLKQRQIETRRYDGIAEMELIVACSNTLQDLGFSLENSETKLGVITASKESSNTGDKLKIILGMAPVIQESIRVSLVTRPVFGSDNIAIPNSHFVRITFHTVIRRTDTPLVNYKTLTDPELFKGFFSKVSKAVFLEAQNI
jgi:hypothetical protein